MSVARSRTRTRASSQVPYSRAPPEGSSVATRSRTRSFSRPGRTEDAITLSAFSRSNRDSWRSSRLRAEEDRRYSRVSFPTVAPDDSISLVKSPSSQESSAFPPQGSRVPGRFSTAGSIHSHAWRASSQQGTALSGSGAPLTKNNLDALSAAPRSIAPPEGKIQDGSYARSLRRASRRLNATVKDAPENAPEARSFAPCSRRQSRRYSTISDDAPEQRSFADRMRPQSRRYSTVLDGAPEQRSFSRRQSQRRSMILDDASEKRSFAPTSSRRYSTNIDERPKTEPETTTSKGSRWSCRRCSVAADTQGDFKETTRTAMSSRRRNTVSANAPSDSRDPTDDPSQVVSSLIPPKQTIAPSKATTRSSQAHTRPASVLAPERPPRSASRAIPVVPVSSGSKQPTAATSRASTVKRLNAATEVQSRRDSMSPTTSTAKESFPIESKRSEDMPLKSGTASQVASQSRSEAPSKPSKEPPPPSNTETAEAPTPPTRPTAPPATQWRENLHIVEVRKPDGRIIQDREYKMQRTFG